MSRGERLATLARLVSQANPLDGISRWEGSHSHFSPQPQDSDAAVSSEVRLGTLQSNRARKSRGTNRLEEVQKLLRRGDADKIENSLRTAQRPDFQAVSPSTRMSRHSHRFHTGKAIFFE